MFEGGTRPVRPRSERGGLPVGCRNLLKRLSGASMPQRCRNLRPLGRRRYRTCSDRARRTRRQSPTAALSAIEVPGASSCNTHPKRRFLAPGALRGRRIVPSIGRQPVQNVRA
jgi:hypothetical protein